MRRRKLNRRQREWLAEALGKAAAGVFVAGFVVVQESGVPRLAGIMTVLGITGLALWLERSRTGRRMT